MNPQFYRSWYCKRAALAGCLVFAVTQAFAQGKGASGTGKPEPYIYTITAERFVAMLHRPEPLAMLEKEKAYSYLDGLRDVTHGVSWCDVNQLKTPDLAYELAAEIVRSPPGVRAQGAAPILLSLLQRKYPC